MSTPPNFRFSTPGKPPGFIFHLGYRPVTIPIFPKIIDALVHAGGSHLYLVNPVESSNAIVYLCGASPTHMLRKFIAEQILSVLPVIRPVCPRETYDLTEQHLRDPDTEFPPEVLTHLRSLAVKEYQRFAALRSSVLDPPEALHDPIASTNTEWICDRLRMPQRVLSLVLRGSSVLDAASAERDWRALFLASHWVQTQTAGIIQEIFHVAVRDRQENSLLRKLPETIQNMLGPPPGDPSEDPVELDYKEYLHE